MLNTFRKVMLMSIGAVSLTKERAEQIVKELTDKGKVNTKEAKSFVQELIDKGENERKAIQKLVSEEVNRFFDEMGLVTKKDWEELNSRLSRIEQLLAQGDDSSPNNNV
ncbi:MAG: hypothetical protein H0Z39_07855 [Peptococcaceae bacterium]|nr:hypothetical protein [Peptococcaceae bacterium]